MRNRLQCFLLLRFAPPIIVLPQQLAHHRHYAYEKLGSCALLTAIQPLTGYRLGQVHARRTKKEYTLFMQVLATAFPDAEKIRGVQDNLNTHDVSALHEHLPADEDRALAKRFEFYYTPKTASWLNMIEIEFSALARQCLHRRIPTLEILAREVLTLLAERMAKGIKIDWHGLVNNDVRTGKVHYG